MIHRKTLASEEASYSNDGATEFGAQIQRSQRVSHEQKTEKGKQEASKQLKRKLAGENNLRLAWIGAPHVADAIEFFTAALQLSF